MYISGVKFAYVSVDYSVCFACCVFDGVCELFVECICYLYGSPQCVRVLFLIPYLLFRCSFHMFVLLCCTREIISRFIPFSVGSCGLLVRVVYHSAILCLMSSGESLYYAFCLLECDVCLLVELLCW